MILNELQRKACGVIAGHYEPERQEFQAVQELSELICVLARRKDQRKDGFTKSLVDEIADSLIMIEQMRQIHCITQEQIDERVNYKLDRQLNRIAQEQG